MSRYGPHRTNDNPQSVTIMPPRPTDKGDTRTLPYPAALARQRRAINTRAYEQ